MSLDILRVYVTFSRLRNHTCDTLPLINLRQGDYVFTYVCLSVCMSVCLSVCLLTGLLNNY